MSPLQRPLVQMFRNYRCHPEIVDAASKLVYHGKMVSGHDSNAFPSYEKADCLFTDGAIDRMLNGV